MKLEVVLAGGLMLLPGGGKARSSARAEQATAERQVLPSVDDQPTCEMLDKHTGEKRPVPDCEAGKLVKRVDPVYPPLARQARISGTVTLHALIDKKGKIEQLELISGHPMLVQASINAVKQWEYEPTLVNGKPVEVDTTIDVVFDLTPEPSDSKIVAQSADAAFRSGNALMGDKKYCEALIRYKDGLHFLPNDTSLLFNAGMAALRCKQYTEALNFWSGLKTLDPEDWQARAGLIQIYQALGKLPERDAERAALFELRKRNPNSELAKQVEYCRDRFEAGGEQVLAFEHFELKGNYALRYVFRITDESGYHAKYRLSLGSYDSTNAIWHETTKPTPKDTDRLFHLDGYYEWGHATYGMYFPEPSYDQVRATVVEVLEKKKQPMSTSTINSSTTPD